MKPVPAPIALSGRSICITGTLVFPREVMHRYLEQLGASPDDKPRSSTSILLVGQKPGGAKTKLASVRGSIVVQEKDFWMDWVPKNLQPPLVRLWLHEDISWDLARDHGKHIGAAQMLNVSALHPTLRDAYIKMTTFGKPHSAEAKAVIKSVLQAPTEHTFGGFCELNGIDLESYSISQKKVMYEVWNAFKNDPVITQGGKLSEIVLKAAESNKVVAKPKLKPKKPSNAQMNAFVQSCTDLGIDLGKFDDVAVESMFQVWLATKAEANDFEEAVTSSSMPESLKKALVAPKDPPKKKDDPPSPKGRLIDV